MTTVSLEATWRVANVTINSVLNYQTSMFAQCEVVLSDSGDESAAAMMPRANNGSYGSMPGATVARTINAELLLETVDIDGKPVTLAEVIQGLNAFVEKWRVEDSQKPSPVPPVPGA